MIPNFILLKEGVMRGGQPDSLDAIDLCKRFPALNQVVKLNESTEPNWPDTVSLFDCPISLTAQVLTEPDLQRILDVVGFIGPGTFVHCEHGQDRTGLIIAVWRVKRCGWSVEKARAEMLALGYHWILTGLDKAFYDLCCL